MDTDMAHREYIQALWKERHCPDNRRRIRAVMFTLKARRESRRRASKK